MTMPAERRRALRWANESLRAIAEDKGIPRHLKAEIDALLQAFPDDRTLATCFLEQQDEAIPAMLASIKAAQAIFESAGRCPALSEQTRRMARVVDRHFPQPEELGTAWPFSDGRGWVEFFLLRDLDVPELQRELQGLGIGNLSEAMARFTRLAALRLPVGLGLRSHRDEEPFNTTRH
jgi:hypothetical protein